MEYIQVGKGRDMGFDSINSFESKVNNTALFQTKEPSQEHIRQL